jgi:hypothetical protein
MAFIKSGSKIISFAGYDDVVDRDQRVFDANEGLTDDVVENLLVRETERILTKIRSTTWWKDLFKNQVVPDVNASLILARQNDFTDLCVYGAMAEYILPLIADFGTQDNAERQKMMYYTQKADSLFDELIAQGDWYDFNASGTIDATEKHSGSNAQRKRIR